MTAGVQDSGGVAFTSGYTGYFYTGTAADTTAPVILGVAPPNNQQNVGLNGLVVVTFNEPIDPITVSSASVSLGYGSPSTPLPTTWSFNSTNTQVTFAPTTPLPPSSTITVSITSGVQDVAGNSVAAQSTTFKTAATADTVGPTIAVTPPNGATNVPTNSAVVIQYSEPIDIQTVSPSYTYLLDSVTGQTVAANLSVTPDGLTATLTPTTPLPVGTALYVYSSEAQDLSGNLQQGSPNSLASSFTTSYNAQTTVPQVVATNPANGAAGVPTNTILEIFFNEPVDPVTLGQVTLTQGGSTVSTTQSLSNGNQTLSLTPATPLLPSLSYAISITGVKDTAGNTLAGTITSTFSTGSTIDLNAPTVSGFNPVSGSTGVGLNVQLVVTFSKPIDPQSLTASQFGLFDYNTGYKLSGTFALAANATSATFTPSESLQPNTYYTFEVATCYYIFCPVASGYTDVAGNPGSGSYTLFTTGTSSVTTAPTVVSINPPNGTTSTVPENVQIAAIISTQVDPLTVSQSAITLTPSVAGTVSLASDQVTLQFVPNANLAPSTTYTINVSGFKDVNGNTVTPFTSSFKTNGTTVTTGPTVTVTPTAGATITSLTTPAVFTFSSAINPGTVTSGTVYGQENCGTGGNAVAGSLAVSNGNTVVTFTPLAPWTPSTGTDSCYVYVYANGVQDPEGNVVSTNTYFYTPVTAPVVTPLTITSVTPANGATGVGQNAVVSVTFSHSVNPATITVDTLGLYNGDTYINVSPSMSADNRTASFTTTLPPSSTITVVSYPGITDLSGNALTTNLDSQFTTAATPPSSGPSIVTMLPGNGATGIPTSAVITLFANAPLNQSTISGGLHIVQNGVSLSGTTNVTGGGTSIEFVPSAALTYGALIEIHLDSTITDQNGNPLTAFYGSFTVAGNPATTAPVEVAVSPMYGAQGIPLNASVFFQFSQTLKASTVNSSTAYLTDQNGNIVPSTTTLLPSGNTIQIKPSSVLTAGTSSTSTYYSAYVTTGVQNTNGDTLASQASTYFYTGSATDTTAPTVLGVAPTNNQQNVGLNGLVEVTFSKPINPVTVTSTSVSLSYGSTPTQIPTSIMFDSTNTYVTFTPVEPLPASTSIKVTITGVQDVAGNPVATQSTAFTTGSVADTVPPTVVSYSPAYQATNVPTNAAVVLQFSEPMNLSSIIQYYCVYPYGYYYYYYSNCLYDVTLGSSIPAAVSLSADGMTATFKPSSALNAGDTVNVYSYGATDLAGNVETGFSSSFTVGSAPDTTPPHVLSVNPLNNLTNVPINAVVQVLFDRPVAANSLSQVTLKTGGTAVVTSPTLSSAGQELTLNTSDLLTPGTSYTITVNGVADLAGNSMSTAVSDTFTTGSIAELADPSVVSVTPANGATMVATNSSIVVQFTNPMNPVSFSTNSFILTETSTNTVVPGTFTLSSDAKTVTFTPSSSLASGGVQYTLTIPYNGYLQPNQVTDVALNPEYPTFTSFFQTQ